MIDPHVHCRDWNQSYKETIGHALYVADRAGIDGIFDMPNTDPQITTRELVERRLDVARKVGSRVFYGLYVGVTSDENQIREAVKTHDELFPEVVGLKMYAGHSVGNLAITKEEDQRKVYVVLSECGYKGMLAVHCEKESLMKPDLWDPSNPVSHSYARPPEAEIESVDDQINFALEARYGGKLRIVHASLPRTIDLIEDVKKQTTLDISCGVTPHHCVLNKEVMLAADEPILLKINSPLRSINASRGMTDHLRKSRTPLIAVESDHSPHLLKEKTSDCYLSGFPGLPFIPHFLKHLRGSGFSEQQILKLTHYNTCKIFGIDIPRTEREADLNLQGEYEVDAYKLVREKWK